jgi:aldehyde:ferredoxin oxidoreductase
MAGGYTGKYCIINLTDGSTEIVTPGEAFYKKYLSGYGLGAAVIMERQKPGVDPLSPENYLGFCSGLLSGTKALFSGRYMVVGKSPLTGGWGDANSGGFLSQAMKQTGYDAVFFTGASDTPIWIDITDEKIQIKDAAGLWGKNIIETEEGIRKELGQKNVQVACIGMSGEKQSLISGIATDKGRIAARSGMGAVMGSKNLKAVAFHGKFKIPVANPEAIKEMNKEFMVAYGKTPLSVKITLKLINFLSKHVMPRVGMAGKPQPELVRELYKKWGTPGLTLISAMSGDMPIKNWTGAGVADFSYDSAMKGHGDNVTRYQKKRYACQACPLGCGGIIDIEKGKFKGKQGHKPEYETIGAFGGMLLQDDFDAIIEQNEICNLSGIDTISTGGTIAFAIECFENKIIDESDTGGLVLEWGKSETISKLTEMIATREGFGDILADGVKKAAQRIGKGAEKYAIHAGGQELPMHDSRCDIGYAVAYECEPTPGRHTISSLAYSELWQVEKLFPAAKKMMEKAKGKENKVVHKCAVASIYMQLMNCAGMCMFGPTTGPVPTVDYFNAVTGWDMTPDEYFKIGERILSLRKAFNMREGIAHGDQRLENRASGRTPVKNGPLKGVTVDTDTLTTLFYDSMGWDKAKGGPTSAKLKELGIEELV